MSGTEDQCIFFSVISLQYKRSLWCPWWGLVSWKLLLALQGKDVARFGEVLVSCVVKDWAVNQVKKVEGRGTSMGEAEALKGLSQGTSWYSSVVNLPSNARDHDFRPWSGKQDSTCCGATKPIPTTAESPPTARRSPLATVKSQRRQNKETKN